MYSLIYHPDPKKREDFLSSYKDTPSPRKNNQKKYTTFQNTLIAWESAPHIPVHTHQSESGTQAWVLGHIEDISIEANPAEFLGNRYDDAGHDGCTGYSGFFVFVLFDGDNLTIGTDQLGLFPAYYYQSDDYLILGSSPATPQMLPGVTLQPNIYGIVGILLAMHELDNQSVWSGVRRIPAGKILRWNNFSINILDGVDIPVSDEYFSLPFESLVDITDEALSESVQRYSNVDILLSGGLDSRLLSGYLKRSGVSIRTCYTLGNKSDIEWKCAHPVAKHLNVNHIRIPVDLSSFQRYAYNQIRQEQLASGVADLSWWSLVDLPDNSHPLPFMNGFLGDAVLGGSHIPWALNMKERSWSADKLFKSVNNWGADINLIKRVFNQNVDPIINDLAALTKKNYLNFDGYPYQKAWQYDLRNRQRYYIAGILFRIAYHSWPSTPYTSNPVLKCAGGMPASSIMQRRIQKELLRKNHFKLAQIPLDNSELNPVAICPTIPRRVIDRIRQLLPKRNAADARNYCYYQRVFDVNNSGWRPLFQNNISKSRKSKSNSGMLNSEALADEFEKMLDMKYVDNIPGYVGFKSFLCLSIWMGEDYQSR